MPEWLQESFKTEHDVSVLSAAIRLAVALALGCVVAGVYYVTNAKARTSSTGLIATLVLLTVLIAMVTLVIGNSVARAFSLVGALAIVRFRTVVEDTRDTAFVIFAVGVGMAVGAGFFIVPILAIPFATIAAFVFRASDEPKARPENGDYSLNIRVGLGQDPEAMFRELFRKHLRQSRLIAVTTARQGAALDLSYVVALAQHDRALALVNDLNGIEGVQQVELRRA